MINVEIIQEADAVLVMEQGQKEALQNEFRPKKDRIFLLSEVTKGMPYDIPDPLIDPQAGNVAAEIHALIQKHVEKIVALAKA